MLQDCGLGEFFPKDLKKLLMDYANRKNAWMPSAIFNQWLEEWDQKRIIGWNRDMESMTNNSLAHPNVCDELSNIKLTYIVSEYDWSNTTHGAGLHQTLGKVI